MQRDNRLDFALFREEKIVPSSGFTDAVMKAIRTDAEAPPPIAFPWRLAIPGLASVIVLVLGLLIAGFSNQLTPNLGSGGTYTLPSALTSVLAHLLTPDMQQILLVSLLTFVVARFFIRLQLFR